MRKQTASVMLAVLVVEERRACVATIYVRGVSGELDAWLDERARYLGMSKAALVRLYLNMAKGQVEEQEGKTGNTK